MPRVVLYAEGPGETGAVANRAPAPGKRLTPDDEGPGHIVVRRACVLLGVHNDSIRFEQPLRLVGREVRGADLLDCKVLRRVLTWPTSTAQPDVAVVLVDQDGVSTRRNALLRCIADPPLLVKSAIGIAVEEFESWMVADHGALMRVSARNEQQGKSPESLKPGEAKRRLQELLSGAAHTVPQYDLRRELARDLDMNVVLETCRSFKRFFGDLKQAIGPRA